MSKLWANTDFDVLKNGLTTDHKKLRHNIRYACFRVQNEKCGGAKAEKKHHKIAKMIEAAKGFEGWEHFAATWDIASPDPITIVPRKWSIYQEWDQSLLRVVKPLPTTTPPQRELDSPNKIFNK